MRDVLAFAGEFRWERWSPGGRVLLAQGRLKNGITAAALNHVLETQFRGGTPVTAWYGAPISATGYTGVSSADTMSSHAGWQELTGYSESTRRQWSPAAAAGGVLANSSPMTYTVSSASVSWRGFFLSSSDTKGGTTGTLWCTALESATQTAYQGEIVKVTYTLTAAAGAGS